MNNKIYKTVITLEVASEKAPLIDGLFIKLRREKISMDISFKVYDITKIIAYFPESTEVQKTKEHVRFIVNNKVIELSNESISSLLIEDSWIFEEDMI